LELSPRVLWDLSCRFREMMNCFGYEIANIR